jgi:hypothetical protein
MPTETPATETPTPRILKDDQPQKMSPRLTRLLDSAADCRKQWRKKYGRKELGLSPGGKSFLHNI